MILHFDCGYISHMNNVFLRAKRMTFCSSATIITYYFFAFHPLDSKSIEMKVCHHDHWASSNTSFSNVSNYLETKHDTYSHCCAIHSRRETWMT